MELIFKNWWGLPTQRVVNNSYSIWEWVSWWRAWHSTAISFNFGMLRRNWRTLVYAIESKAPSSLSWQQRNINSIRVISERQERSWDLIMALGGFLKKYIWKERRKERGYFKRECLVTIQSQLNKNEHYQNSALQESAESINRHQRKTHPKRSIFERWQVRCVNSP